MNPLTILKRQNRKNFFDPPLRAAMDRLTSHIDKDTLRHLAEKTRSHGAVQIELPNNQKLILENGLVVGLSVVHGNDPRECYFTRLPEVWAEVNDHLKGE